MKKVFNLCLNLVSKAVAATSLFLVYVSMGTMSAMGVYEPEMPIAIRPKDDEANT